MNKINLYIYKYKSEKHEPHNYFSKYRLNKINSSTNSTFINRSIQTEMFLYECLVVKNNVKNFEFKEVGAGRPILVDEEVHFNIAHSKDYLIVAVANFNISVDIEYIDKRRMRIRNLLYKDSTSKNVNDLIKDFTIKEAYVKYYSESITQNLKEILIDETYVYKTKGDKLRYQSFKYEKYYITIAAKELFKVIINNLIN